jgi:uncharacterized protein YecT (DUF1311 family)
MSTKNSVLNRVIRAAVIFGFYILMPAMSFANETETNPAFEKVFKKWLPKEPVCMGTPTGAPLEDSACMDTHISALQKAHKALIAKLKQITMNTAQRDCPGRSPRNKTQISHDLERAKRINKALDAEQKAWASSAEAEVKRVFEMGQGSSRYSDAAEKRIELYTERLRFLLKNGFPLEVGCSPAV